MGIIGKIVAGLVVVFLAIAGYQFLIKDSAANPSSTVPGGIVTEDFTAGTADNQEFLRVLKNLESVSLDGSVLSSEAFTSLIDFSVALQDQPKGRVNPFKPINPFEPGLIDAGVQPGVPAGTPVAPATTTAN
ncbi:MAG TPA: hypothetical protein VI953_00955 [Candidatus Paceibacterota bacterium]